LFREPLPGEIEAHRERSNGPIFILDFVRPQDGRTDPRPH
jgi:hypothetical protein